MRKDKLLLCGSLICNLVFGALLARSCSSGESTTPTTASGASRQDESGPVAFETASEITGLLSLDDLLSDDPATLAANLRAAAFPEHITREAVRARIDALFRLREEALFPPKPNLRYWQVDTTMESLEVRLERLELDREKTQMLGTILGWNSLPPPSQKYPVAEEKQLELHLIVSQFDAIIDEIAGRKYLPPSDQELLDFVQREKQREIANLLTLEEQQDFEMVTSWTGRVLSRTLLRDADVTEGEFRELYRLQKEFDDRFVRLHADGTAEFANMTGYQAARDQLNEDIAALLGDSQSREVIRSGDAEFRQLAALARRAGIAKERAHEILDLRESVANESNRIVDQNVPSEDKRTMLRTLATQTRQRIQEALGPEAGEAYLDIANSWLAHVERGGAFTYSSGAWGFRSVEDTGPTMIRLPSLPTP